MSLSFFLSSLLPSSLFLSSVLLLIYNKSTVAEFFTSIWQKPHHSLEHQHSSSGWHVPVNHFPVDQKRGFQLPGGVGTHGNKTMKVRSKLDWRTMRCGGRGSSVVFQVSRSRVKSCFIYAFTQKIFEYLNICPTGQILFKPSIVYQLIEKLPIFTELASS